VTTAVYCLVLYRSWRTADARNKCIYVASFIIALLSEMATIFSSRCFHKCALQQYYNEHSNQPIRETRLLVTSEHVDETSGVNENV